jgi:hypothetical protein
MKSHQETFNLLYESMLKQGCLGKDLYDTPQYKQENGLKCAVGHLITNDKYHEGLERTLCVQALVSEILYDENYDVNFVYELQKIHDNSYNFDEYKSRMIKFANSRGIEINVNT